MLNKPKVLKQFPNLRVLGQFENGDVFLFSKDTRSTRQINISRLTQQDVILLAGIDPRNRLNDLKDEIAFIARRNQLWKKDKRGQGIWKHTDDELLIVNGDEAYLWNSGNVTQSINIPVWKNYLILFQPGAKWSNGITTNSNPLDSFNKLRGYLSQWKWTSHNDACFIAALIFATPFQQIWSWKPHIYVTGRANTGKTTLLKFLKDLFENLGLAFDGYLTEAGLRQKIQNESKCVLLDEFEKVKHEQRELIMSVLRISSRGGTVTRGTQSGNSIDFQINHMVWLASIEVPIKEAADIGRYHVFKITTGQKINPLSRSEISIIFQDIISFGLMHFQKLQESQKRIIAKYEGKVDNRLVQSYSVPLSILEVLRGDDPFEILDKLQQANSVDDIQQDEDRLIECILSSKIWSNSRHEQATVGDLLSEAVNDNDIDKLLKGNGIAITTNISNNRKYVAFHPNSVLRYLLKGTDWQGLGIKDILLRAPGAEEKQVKFNNRLQRAVRIPIEVILAENDNEK